MLLKPSLQQVNTGEYIIATAFICYNRPRSSSSSSSNNVLSALLRHPGDSCRPGVVLVVGLLRCLSLDGAARCKRRRRFSGRSMFFFSFDATAQQRPDGFFLTKSLPRDVFAVSFVNGGTPINRPLKKLAAKSSSLSENSNSAVFGRPLRENDEVFWEN